MNRREFLGDLVLAGAALPLVKSDVRGAASADLTQDWLARHAADSPGVVRRNVAKGIPDEPQPIRLGWTVCHALVSRSRRGRVHRCSIGQRIHSLQARRGKQKQRVASSPPTIQEGVDL
jgi:hypothetical protein